MEIPLMPFNLPKNSSWWSQMTVRFHGGTNDGETMVCFIKKNGEEIYRWRLVVVWLSTVHARALRNRWRLFQIFTHCTSVVFFGIFVGVTEIQRCFFLYKAPSKLWFHKDSPSTAPSLRGKLGLFPFTKAASAQFGDHLTGRNHVFRLEERNLVDGNG